MQHELLLHRIPYLYKITAYGSKKQGKNTVGTVRSSPVAGQVGFGLGPQSRKALRSRANGFGLGPQSRKLQRPVSCLTVRTMASLSESPPCFFATSQQPLNLSLPMISLCTTNHDGVSVCMSVFCNNFCSVCVCVHLCSLVYSLLFQMYDQYTAPFDTVYLLVIALAFLKNNSSSPSPDLSGFIFEV